MILALKSAGEVTELVLMDVQGRQSARLEWQSGRQLAEQLLGQIEDFLNQNHTGLRELTGLAVFRGPGSFTSLRIGIATVNALAYALAVPNTGAEGESWLAEGIKTLKGQKNPQIITPLYDRGPNVTKPKK